MSILLANASDYSGGGPLFMKIFSFAMSVVNTSNNTYIVDDYIDDYFV